MSNQEYIRGGVLLARSLQEKGISQIFTLSGGFCNPALEGLAQCGICLLYTSPSPRD